MLAKRWFVDHFTTVNLILISLCIIGYAATVYLLTYWTFWRWPPDELGGLLDYRWFGISVVYHVTEGNREAIFSFPDFASYLLISFVIFSLAALFLNRNLGTDDQQKRIRNTAILSTVIALLSVAAYAWTMMSVDSTLRTTFSVPNHTGGVVQYQFPIGMLIVPTLYGIQESWNVFKYPFPDITGWLLLALLIFAVKLFRQKPNKAQIKASL